MYAPEPVNFLLQAGTKAAFRFEMPAASAVVEALRKDPATRILPGRTQSAAASSPAVADTSCRPGTFSVLETCSGRDHLNSAQEATFAARFRAMPLAEALATPFNMACFKLDAHMRARGVLAGMGAAVIEPWTRALAAAGFEFDRCLPYVFLSGGLDVGSFHPGWAPVWGRGETLVFRPQKKLANGRHTRRT